MRHQWSRSAILSADIIIIRSYFDWKIDESVKVKKWSTSSTLSFISFQCLNVVGGQSGELMSAKQFLTFILNSEFAVTLILTLKYPDLCIYDKKMPG